MMFWASWLLGPAAGPKGVSIRSPKMGRDLPEARYSLWTPNIRPESAYSVTAQFIREGKGMGYIFSDMGIHSFHGMTYLFSAHAAGLFCIYRKISSKSA